MTFTLEQINELHARLGTTRTLPAYVSGLRELGVERYESYVTDGHSEYFGNDSCKVISPAVHEVLSIAASGQLEMLLRHLRRHERHQTTYLEMSKGLALSGIEKWRVDTREMTMTFFDRTGREMLVERIA